MHLQRYIPHTESQVRDMLQALNLKEVSDLFAHIPDEYKINQDDTSELSFAALGAPVDEESLRKKFSSLANASNFDGVSFLGAGYCPHLVPAIVKQLLLRSEFYTAYTPYQPEVAQGTLQAIFEYQTLICELTGCEVANASLYNGASAAAEACLMALRLTGRKKVLVPRTLHPHALSVLRTYLTHLAQIEVIAFDTETGCCDFSELQKKIDVQTAAVLVQSPNFFGGIEDVRAMATLAHDAGALLIASVAEPLALGLLEAPGRLGADIVVGEGGTFGQGLNFGGPGVGFFATSAKHLRNLPGRLVGETVDAQGKTGYVLTLSTREQHIRRHKATSNICTNQSLCALAFTITLCVLGKKGFAELALMNFSKLQYLTEVLEEKKVKTYFQGPAFNERVFGPNVRPARGILEELQVLGFVGGLPLGEYFPELPELDRCLLICANEDHSKSQMDALATHLRNLNKR